MGKWTEYSLDQIKASSLSSISIGPFGSRLKSDRYVEGGNDAVPVIRGNNISDTKVLKDGFVFVTPQTANELRSANVFPGDLVFPHRGLIGEVGIVPPNCYPRYVLSTSLMKLTCNTEIVDPLFVFYFFRSSLGKHSLLQHASQVGTPGIATPLTSLKSIRLHLPPLPEQRAIAHILGTLDDKIELNRQMNQTLEQIAAELFKSWFVDFDPVRAKAEGRLPEGMDAETAALFPDRLVESEIGEIPEGWEVRDVYNVADVTYGAAFRSSLFNKIGKGHPLIRIRDLASHNPKVFTAENHPNASLVQPGDLVVGMDGEFRAHLWKGPSSLLNQRVCCFRPKPGIAGAFVRYSIAKPLAFFEGSKSGTTVIHLGKGDIDTFRVVVPTPEVIAKFASLSEPLDARIVNAASESRTLAELRDTLLPRLLSGELRVPVDVLNEEAVPITTQSEELLVQSHF